MKSYDYSLESYQSYLAGENLLEKGFFDKPISWILIAFLLFLIVYIISIFLLEQKMKKNSEQNGTYGFTRVSILWQNKERRNIIISTMLSIMLFFQLTGCSPYHINTNPGKMVRFEIINIKQDTLIGLTYPEKDTIRIKVPDASIFRISQTCYKQY